MRCFVWDGIPTYDYFVECNGDEIQELIQHFHIDPRFFHEGFRTWKVCGEEKFYYFINTERKRIALLPFLQIAFGNQFDGYLPIGELTSLQIDFNEYKLEEFRFHCEDDQSGISNLPISSSGHNNQRAEHSLLKRIRNGMKRFFKR